LDLRVTSEAFMSPRQIFHAAAVVAVLAAAPVARAQCPKITIQVDGDISGSGYSEEKPQNWKKHTVGACHKNYVYLSHTIGDGSRKGKAIWKPKITVTGWYEVTTSYRATTNRTNDADYVLYDDAGGKKKVVVNQKHSGDCTKKTLGTIYCKVGGTCRLVLDGTDDSQSDAADITTFKLTKCSGTPPKNPCAGITKNSKWHVCSWTTKTCAGTYDDYAGCAKYCAAAGMVCVARFGGTAPCSKEPNNKIPCAQKNTHQSDYCECAFPDSGVPKQDKGAPPKKDAAVKPKDSAPPKTDRPAGHKDGPTAPKVDAPVTVGDGPAAGKDAPAQPPPGEQGITSGCSCRTGGAGAGATWAAALLLLALWRRRRS